MNTQHLKNQWKFHYKKILAISFTCLALLCLIASGAYTLYLKFYSGSTPNLDTYLSIYDFALFAIAYMMILIGNLNGTVVAYQGMLMYVFMTFLSAILAFIQRSYLDFATFQSGSAIEIVLFLFVLLFYVGIIVSGIMSYIRTTQFLRNSYSNYSGLRNWCLVFVIFNTLLYGAEPALIAVSGGNVALLLMVLEPLSQAFIGFAIFFTVTRLKAEY